MIKKFNSKKLLIILIICSILLTTVGPVIAVSGTGSWVGGQYASNVKTTDSPKGIIIRRLVNMQTKEAKTVFCAEHGVSFNTGVIFDGEYYTPSDEKVIRACKIAYFGWYQEWGDYTVDGGILADDMHWVKMFYVWTQQYIWEVLGQSNATFIDAEVQNQYIDYKRKIDEKINNMKKRPSFQGQNIELIAGQSKTITDTNWVLATYNSIDKTVNKVRFQHNYNENTLTITPSSDCTIENLKISDALTKEWGFIKEESKNHDTSIYFSFPEGVQNQIFAMNYNDPVTVSFSLKIEIFGKLELSKKDNKGNMIPNTTFKVSYNSDMSNPIGTYTTGSNGKIAIEKLKPGIIYIQEISVPQHLILDSSIKSTTIKSGETSNYQATNNWKQSRIQVIKKDKETGKVVKQAGTTFDIYTKSNKKIATITTNTEGIATSNLLDYGTYYIKETKAPHNYTIKVDISEDVGITENGKIYSINILNTRVKGTVNISKEDNITGKKPQGEGTLEGAIYGLYARNAITNPADGSIIYSANTKIQEVKTDVNGNASIKDLYLGSYFLREITPSKGYTLDPTQYDFDITYENQNKSIITKNITVKEKVISQAFQIVKVSSDDNGEAELLKGVEFTIKSKTDVDKYGSWEKAPIARNANGLEASIMKTDNKGYAISDKLAFGTYVVRETKVPSDKYKVPDFTVNITKDSSEPQIWRIFNDTSFRAVVAIVKEDLDTGKIVKIKGAKFKIKNTDTNEYFGYWEWNPLPHYVDFWETDESGTVMTGEKLKAGNYQLEEIESPNRILIIFNSYKIQNKFKCRL